MGIYVGPHPHAIQHPYCIVLYAGCTCEYCEAIRYGWWMAEQDELWGWFEWNKVRRMRRAEEKRRTRLWSLFFFLLVEWIAAMFLALSLQTVTN